MYLQNYLQKTLGQKPINQQSTTGGENQPPGQGGSLMNALQNNRINSMAPGPYDSIAQATIGSIAPGEQPAAPGGPVNSIADILRNNQRHETVPVGQAAQPGQPIAGGSGGNSSSGNNNTNMQSNYPGGPDINQQRYQSSVMMQSNVNPINQQQMQQMQQQPMGNQTKRQGARRESQSSSDSNSGDEKMNGNNQMLKGQDPNQMKNELSNNMQNMTIKDERQNQMQMQNQGMVPGQGGMPDMMKGQGPQGGQMDGGPPGTKQDFVNQKQEQGQLPGNQPAQEHEDKRPAYPKREETVSKLTPQQLAMPRISVYVTVPDKGQKFLAYLDRRVHHTVKDFKLYLGQSIEIDDPDKVTLTKEMIRYQPPVPITDLCMVNHQDKLVLRKDEWFLGRPEAVPYCLKPPEATTLADGTKVYLRPFSFQSENGGVEFYNIVKREGDPNSEAYPIENIQPVFQVMRGNTRQNPRFATLFRSENENTVIKTENGYIPQIKPKYLELSTQIKNLILQKLQEQKEDDELPEGAPRPKRPSGNTIIERYIDRQREEAEAELKYAKTIKLDGFKPWDTWVPMPYPHRELNFARKMYMRGDNLLVQSPDFWEFCNEIRNISNKNTLIWKVKKMAMDRGFRGKLSMQQNDGKSHTVIMICNKSGKSTAKNPSIKAECPFLLQFERKTFLQKQLDKQKMKTIVDPNQTTKEQLDNAAIKDEDSEIINEKRRGDKEFDVKKFKSSLAKIPANRYKNGNCKKEGWSEYDQVDIPGDPYFLAKYRSFHNHDLDTNYVEHAHLVMDEDLHKKGSANLLPQGPCAIQWLSGQRRKEIPEENKMPEMPIQFDQITTVQTLYKLDQFGVDTNHQQLRVIEPAGMPPAMFIIDQVPPPQDQTMIFQNTDDNGNVSWPPIDGMVQEGRSLIVQTMRLALDDVAVRLQDGRYNLDRWRRILTYMKPKAFAKAITADSCFKKNPSTGRLLGLTPAAIAELSGGAARARLAAKEAQGISNLVNQIQSKSSTGRSAPRKKTGKGDSDGSDDEGGNYTANKTLSSAPQKKTGGNYGNTRDQDGDQQMMGDGEEGLVAPDDETYNIYN